VRLSLLFVDMMAGGVFRLAVRCCFLWVPTCSRSAFSSGAGYPRLVGCAVACGGVRVLRMESEGRGGLFGFLGSAVCCALCAVCCVLCDLLGAVSIEYVGGLELRLVTIARWRAWVLRVLGVEADGRGGLFGLLGSVG
jgi:hypothetical protein